MLMALSSVMLCGVANAELPDMTRVWQAIGTGQTEKAYKVVDEMYSSQLVEQQKQRLERGESPTWAKSHSEESSHDVEEWLHFYLIKLYIAQKENNQAEINLQMTNIKQLAYLEYMGKNLVD